MKARKKANETPWYVRAFAADYSARYRHRSDDLAMAELPFVIRALNLPARPLVLDLCCGAGRHSRALVSALKQGRVAALDLSADLLHEAQAKRMARKRIVYLRGDMRRIPIASESLDGVVNLFTSFGYFKTDREHLAVLKEVARVLKPSGRFVIDFFNREWTLANLVPRSESESKGSRIVETRRYDTRSKRILKTIEISAMKSGEVIETLTESVRAYGAEELKKLLIEAGLKPLSLHGDLRGGTFVAHKSPRCVWVCAKGSGFGRHRL